MPLISEAKRAANRANAKRSTGPRTEEGRNVVRFNAVKHGMCAEATVLPGEDPAAFEELRADVLAQLEPEGKMQRELAERAARELWRLRRARVAETGAMRLVAGPYAVQAGSEAPEQVESFAVGQALAQDFRDEGFLEKLSRWEARCARGFERCLRLLKLLRAKPRDAEPAPPEAAPRTERPGDEPRFPAEFGFVPPVFANSRQAALGGVSQVALALAALLRGPEVAWPKGFPASGRAAGLPA